MAARHKKPASAAQPDAAAMADPSARPAATRPAATRQSEIETKLEIAPDAKLPSLSKRRRLAAVGIAGAADPQNYHLDAMYYDTPDLDLLRSKMTLRRRTGAIKPALMNSDVVVGVGNIYASEALFRAGIRPTLRANRLAKTRCERLIVAVRETLSAAIARGGSTLRDYVDSDGRAGYFQLDYFVYGRAGQPCRVCGTRIRATRQAGRATTYCPTCQK